MSRWGGRRACFSRRYLGLFSWDGHLSQTPWLQGSHLARAGRGLEGSISCCFLATFSTNFSSETPGTTISPKSPLFWPRGWVTSPGKPPTPGAKGPGEGTEEGEGHTAQSFPNLLIYSHPLPGLSHSIHPVHPQPRRFIPELTAWHHAEQVKQK